MTKDSASDPDDRGARQTDHRITTPLFTTLDRLQEIAVRPTREFDIATDRCLKISQYLPDQGNAVVARGPVTGEISATGQNTDSVRRQPVRRGTGVTELVDMEIRVTDRISSISALNESAAQISGTFSYRSRSILLVGKSNLSQHLVQVAPGGAAHRNRTLPRTPACQRPVQRGYHWLHLRPAHSV